MCFDARQLFEQTTVNIVSLLDPCTQHTLTQTSPQESHKLAVRGFAIRAALLSGSDTEGWTEDREEDYEDEYSTCRLGLAALAKWAKQQPLFAAAAVATAAEVEAEEVANGPVGDVVAHLTRVEKSLDFQMHLLGSMSQMALDTSYSEVIPRCRRHRTRTHALMACSDYHLESVISHTHRAPQGKLRLRFDAFRQLAACV